MKRCDRAAMFLLGVAASALAPAMAFAADAAASKQAEEIVVTAQFRKESAQKTAVSIDVLTSEALTRAGVAQAADLARLSPGVQITQGGSALQVYIRGAGDFSTTGYSNPAVAQAYAAGGMFTEMLNRRMAAFQFAVQQRTENAQVGRTGFKPVVE